MFRVNGGRVAFLRIVFLRIAFALLPCLLFSSCYSLDDDEEYKENMVERREAQAYIVSSYNKLNVNLVRADFESLGSLDSVLSEYQWEDKEAFMVQARKYASLILNGHLEVLPDIMAFCNDHAGVYKADGNNVFYKTEVAERKLALIFNDELNLSLEWNVTEKSANRLVLDASLSYNRYQLTGTTKVCGDSVCSSYRLLKNGARLETGQTKADSLDATCLMKIERILTGKGFLDAIYGRSAEKMVLLTTDMRMQLMDMLCLHDKEMEIGAIVKYFADNRKLQVDDPKLFLQGWIQLKNSQSRTVLTRPDGSVLCQVSNEVERVDNTTYRILPMLNWSDGTKQSLTEFASASANEKFAKDAALLDKLWKLLRQLYDAGENG